MGCLEEDLQYVISLEYKNEDRGTQVYLGYYVHSLQAIIEVIYQE